MNSILKKISRWILIPELEQALILKLKELKIQFGDKIKALENKATDSESSRLYDFDFVLKYVQEQWITIIDTNTEYDIDEILPSGIKEFIVSSSTNINRLYAYTGRYFNIKKNEMYTYRARYVAETLQYIAGSISWRPTHSEKVPKGFVLSFAINELEITELREFEKYVQALINDPKLRQFAIDQYQYKLKAFCKTNMKSSETNFA